ncbi:MAG: tRNA pseudouridine(55) synthase TruB [Acidimicrobiia bacterium]
MPSGFFCIDKPAGFTSHDVVARVRKALSMKKVGHSGTLDPMATGVMVIGFGNCTRLLDYVQSGVKTYEATIKFGEKTPTADAESEVVESKDMSDLDEGELLVCLEKFKGIIEQTPPMVSAIKVDGKKLYEYQREGIEVERKKRKVEIFEIELQSFENPYAKIAVTCSSGTYIRTLAEDIADCLGGFGHLTQLRRVKNGQVDISECISLDELGRVSEPLNYQISPKEILKHLTQIDLDESQGADISFGKRISLNKKQIKLVSQNSANTFVGFSSTPKPLCAVFKIDEDQIDELNENMNLKSSCIVFLDN